MYNPDAARTSQDPAPTGDEETTSFELPLGTLLECLNIFGSATLTPGSTAKKKKEGDESNDGGGTDGRSKDKGKGRADADPAAAGNARLDQWFAPGGKGTGTGMRLSYAGPGHPLTLFM